MRKLEAAILLSLVVLPCTAAPHDPVAGWQLGHR
jgi:hypothetical protein